MDEEGLRLREARKVYLEEIETLRARILLLMAAIRNEDDDVLDNLWAARGLLEDARLGLSKGMEGKDDHKHA